MFEQFRVWYEQRHAYARDWQARHEGGGEVVATMCTYVPEEVLLAAGMLPVRVLGAHQVQNVAEPHIFGMFCPFSRDSLAQGLLGLFPADPPGVAWYWRSPACITGRPSRPGAIMSGR